MSGCGRLLLVVLAILFWATPAQASQRVSFRTDDGVTIAATWYEPSSRPAPAVILVHMLHRSRRDWDSFAQRLASEGIGALAIDLRGHGDSSGGVDPSASEGYAPMVQDIRAARRYLATRGDVVHSRVGVAGASLGANLAILASAADAAVTSVALLSPSLDYRGIRVEAAAKKLTRPMLLVASSEDFYAARTCRELQRAGGGTRELQIIDDGGHGTSMIARHPDLTRLLVDWFRRTI
jgi:alpha-beta hydrolase superfamily lysophospholipase